MGRLAGGCGVAQGGWSPGRALRLGGSQGRGALGSHSPLPSPHGPQGWCRGRLGCGAPVAFLELLLRPLTATCSFRAQGTLSAATRPLVCWVTLRQAEGEQGFFLAGGFEVYK